MFRVSWAARSAEEKILELKRGRRRRARKAFEYLMAAEESEYRVFAAKHKKCLRKHPEATERERKRPLQYIQTTGLERALWPHLYWVTEMTETCERNTDSRRLQAGAAQRRLSGPDSEEEEEDETAERHSVKRSFLRKVLGPIVGYLQDFELLQFVHDLALWSRIGGGKNARLPLRLVLKGETFSPLYWKTKHQALLDMQRQCGFPALFKTMAPWEFSFPYHKWVLQELELGGRRRQLAGPETLHTAHVFLELNMAGRTTSSLARTAARPWPTTSSAWSSRTASESCRARTTTAAAESTSTAWTTCRTWRPLG